MMSFSHEQSTSLAQVPLWLLVELANELSTATNLETLQRILARKLRWIFNFDRCTLAIGSQPTDTEYVLLDITSPSKAESTLPQKFAFAQGWCGKAIAESKPYFIADLTQLPSAIALPRDAYIGLSANAFSLIVLPLKVGRTIGSLNFSSNKPNAYPLSWHNIASLLACQVAGQLSSVLAQEETSLALKALAVSQAKLKSAYEFRSRVMESATNAIYALDLQGNFTLVNRRMAKMTGYAVETLLGFPFIELFSPTEASNIQQQLLAIVNDGISIDEYHSELIKKDESAQMISWSLAPILLDGDISALVGTAQEVN